MRLDSGERDGFLDKACDGDVDFRIEVESLLISFADAKQFLERPIVVDFGGRREKKWRLEDGKEISHYRIVSPIASGGMGEVYLAEDTQLARRVAIKLLPSHLSDDRDRLRRFQHEARVVSALNHPNILTIFEFGNADGTDFLASEFVAGETLRERLSKGRLEVGAAVDIATQIVSALKAAHEAGVVHRDIKPENIMIRDDGYVKILDFGLAKLTENASRDLTSGAGSMHSTPGLIMGTVTYMSPEQTRATVVLDARSDIFSFGVVLFEMLTGRVPFSGETMADVVANILQTTPRNASRYNDDVSEHIDAIVAKSLEKERHERYQTAADLLADLKALPATPEAVQKTVPSSPEPATQILAAPTRPEPNAEPERNRKYVFAAAAALIVLLLAGTGYWFYAVRNPGQINSIAVLPFENVSGSADLDYLSDGVSESVIDRLAQLPQIKVIARNSSFKYRGKDIDITEVANALGVRAVVIGKVTNNNGNLIIRTELIDVGDNRQLWSETYNRRMTDLQTVQGEIAQTVSEKLRLRLTGTQEQLLAKTATVSSDAYNLYLTGLFVAKTDMKKSLDYFTQATTLDPNFALAFYQVGSCNYYLGYNSVLDPKVTTPKARTALQRALDLDDSLAEAHFLMAQIRRNAGDVSGAEMETNRGLELNPNTADAHGIRAERFAKAGKIEEALSESRLAQQLDPLAINRKIQEGGILYHARRFDEAITKFQQIVNLAPDNSGGHAWLGYAYNGKGMYREAIAEFQQSIKLGDNTSDQCYLGYALAKSDNRGDALVILDKLKTTKDYVSPSELAILYVGLGEKDAAFQSLEKAFTERDLQLQNLKSDPHFDDLHDDRRFTDLVRRVGLP